MTVYSTLSSIRPVVINQKILVMTVTTNNYIIQ